MITGELKNKINSLWEIFWTGGITNPLDVVEQMTYLMFIHDLDETDGRVRIRQSLELNVPKGADIPSERTVYRVMEQIGRSHHPRRNVRENLSCLN